MYCDALLHDVKTETLKEREKAASREESYRVQGGIGTSAEVAPTRDRLKQAFSGRVESILPPLGWARRFSLSPSPRGLLPWLLLPCYTHPRSVC
jgi:hypothetical protein